MLVRRKSRRRSDVDEAAMRSEVGMGARDMCKTAISGVNRECGSLENSSRCQACLGLQASRLD